MHSFFPYLGWPEDCYEKFYTRFSLNTVQWKSPVSTSYRADSGSLSINGRAIAETTIEWLFSLASGTIIIQPDHVQVRNSLFLQAKKDDCLQWFLLWSLIWSAFSDTRTDSHGWRLGWQSLAALKPWTREMDREGSGNVFVADTLSMKWKKKSYRIVPPICYRLSQRMSNSVQ